MFCSGPDMNALKYKEIVMIWQYEALLGLIMLRIVNAEWLINREFTSCSAHVSFNIFYCYFDNVIVTNRKTAR